MALALRWGFAWLLLHLLIYRCPGAKLVGTGHDQTLKKPRTRTSIRVRGRLRSAFGGGDIVEEDGQELEPESAECSKPFPAPARGSKVCPEECPFMRFDPQRVCHWMCITEAECLTAPNMPSSVANNDTGMCAVCSVAGCARCENTATRCRECKQDFELVGERCLPYSRHKWHRLYVALGVLLSLVLVYIVSLACRPIVNQRVLDQALLFRSNAKIREDNERHRLYPLRTDLRKKFISHGGAGVLLHFRFEYKALQWAVFVTLVMGSVAFWHRRLHAADILSLTPTHDEAYRTCVDMDESDAQQLEFMRIDFLIATGIVYATSTCGALWFAVRQRQEYVELDEQNATMEDYALWCSGFPRDSWGDAAPTPEQPALEDEFLAFFRQSGWGDSVLGVSIVWDIAGREDEIHSILGAAVNEHEQEHANVVRMRKLRHSTSQLSSTSIETIPESPHEVGKPRGFCGVDFEGPLLGLPLRPSTDAPPSPQAFQRDPLAELRDLQTTGTVFVVFRTKRDLQAAQKKPLQKFRGEYQIKSAHLECDAATVLWDGFSITNAERVCHIVRGILGLLILIFGWALCFYGPYAYYVISWYRVAGASQGMTGIEGFLQTTLLGLVVALGNQLVYAACANIAEHCKFRSRDSRDMLNVVLYTIAVSVNTVIDLWLITLMAHGWQQDTGMDAEALVRNPSMQHALFVQLAGYIYPGTILLPFLAEPFAIVTAPYFLFKWLVRSRSDVSRWKAEQCLVCAPFDLNRYGDIIINMVLCSLIFFLTSVNIWWMFAQLITSSMVIYYWDRYRFLRASQRTIYATQQLDICGQYLMVLPCMILAGAFMFKYQGGQAMVQRWDRRTFLDVRIEWLACLAAMVVHAFVHILLLLFVVPMLVPDAEEETTSFEESAKNISCTWFNANPVHCLRSMHYFKHKPPHIFDMPGKGYLHKVNPAIHAYYEAPYFEAEQNLVVDALSEVRWTVQRVGSSVGHFRTEAHRQLERATDSFRNFVRGHTQPLGGDGARTYATATGPL